MLMQLPAPSGEFDEIEIGQFQFRIPLKAGFWRTAAMDDSSLLNLMK
jgi:hypothetical protein